MRTLALDIGDVRIGVALSDPQGNVSTPLTVLDTKAVRAKRSVLFDLFSDYEIERIVVGLPRSLDGEEGPQARHVRALAAKLLESNTLPVEFVDERYSSVEAKRVMASQGFSERDMRGSIDKVAASIFLQSFLDTHKGART